MTGPETRPSLVLRLQNSADQRAWAEFVEIYQPLILRTLRSRGLQEADAREVCQEVLLAVSRAVERWDARPERGSFRGWLSSITRNLCVNFLIRRARHPQPLGDETQLREWLESAPAADSEASRWFALEERRQQLRWAAERVRPEFRETAWTAFWETAVEGRDAASVAAQLGVAVGVVYVSRSRVMKRLRIVVQQVRDESTEGGATS
ncbi:MAG: sigma-70 family RNA polymerase sigma factor [Pirellulales bacterium]